MSPEPTQQTATPSRRFSSQFDWQSGAVAGAVAAAVMAVVISVADLPLLRDAIAGLYLLEGSLVAGVLVHIVHGTLFGVIFAALLSDPGLHGITQWRWKCTVAGIVYGFVLAVAGAGIIMPIWLNAVGASGPQQIPNVTIPSLAWHVVYGTVLGLAFSTFAPSEQNG